MAAAGATPARVQEYMARQLGRIARLRATGPNPFDYFIWADETSGIVSELFGEGSDELQAFRLAVIDSGRTDDQRGILDNMTLGLHGEWGIWARLDRAEHVMRQIMAEPA
jgi:hypothetical protein